jgi:steroid delta-isomerase-like uncharacterized protein
MLTPEENKARVRSAFEEFINKQNLAAVPEYVAPNFVGHYPGFPPVQGVEGFTQFLSMYNTAFGNSRVTIEDIIAEGDKVAVRLTFRATHTGEFAGIPPTGKQITLSAINFFQILDGKAVEQWVVQDDLGMMQQLGVMPPPPGGS